MHIGTRLKKIRKIKKLGQSKICHNIISTSHYSNVESGRYEASEELLIALAVRMEVPENYLLRSDEFSEELELLLEDYQKSIKSNLNTADQFLEDNKKKFEYILSMDQEITFLLYNCLHLLLKKNLTDASEKFEELSIYINSDTIHHFSRDHLFFYYYCSGLIKYYERNFKEGFDLLRKALLYLEKHNIHYEGRIFYNLALICFHLNKMRKAIAYIEKTISQFTNSEEWNVVVECYGLRGVFYTEIYDYKNAIESYDFALNLSTKYNYDLSKGKLLHNLGMVYFKISDYKSALDYLNKSLDHKLNHKSNNHDLFITYLAIIDTKLEMNNNESINDLFDRAKKLTNTQIEEYRLQELNARLAFLSNDFEKYEKQMIECIEYYYENKHWHDIENRAKELSDYYYEQRKYKMAYYFLNIELEARDYLYKQRA
ncbi:tetratricopeptide repeat protein [Evansella tamaricis]|uniref:Tetratricopeptide repeat protein n=1 Tax=Evansella tamaricis TaxID=2069301 RepID=A0ABS6JIV6_9BACI|nr:tetratricopeptide repeat protein [Evansella tamaricis]MBU9713612.1 tetratricopeptide repeat protein [Evansella tamaricis]